MSSDGHKSFDWLAEHSSQDSELTHTLQRRVETADNKRGNGYIASQHGKQEKENKTKKHDQWKPVLNRESRIWYLKTQKNFKGKYCATFVEPYFHFSLNFGGHHPHKRRKTFATVFL